MRTELIDADDAELIRQVRQAAAGFRRRNPLTRAPWEASSYPIAAYIDGRPAVKTLAWFPGPGCTWSEAGGCLMCNFGTSIPGSADPISLFADHLAELDRSTEHLHIGPGGSFYDERETPTAHRHGVLRALAALPELRTVGIETRPNLVTQAHLRRTLDDLPSGVTRLILGFGLECWDDFTRELSVNKGYSRDSIVRAAEVIDKVNAEQSSVQVEFETYVLLKPTLLSEREAVDEALRTIDWSFRVGAGTTALFMNTVKDATVQGFLASSGSVAEPLRYRTPYLRSAIEVLRRLPDEMRIRTSVLGVQSGIQATGGPRGCERCYPFLLGAIYAHNFTRIADSLETAARSWCPCKSEWSTEMAQSPSRSLRDRASALLRTLAEESA